jgi:hypothetical protein
MLRRRLAPWLFALTLLLSQIGALAHATSHVSEPDSGLPDHVCELCLAYANLGSGATATPLALSMPDAAYHWNFPSAATAPETRPPVARARAPPAVV